MTDKVTQVIPIPYLLIVFSLIPILLIANLLPACAITDRAVQVERFLDHSLFPLSGFWSSLFPFSSRLTTLYISLFGPLFAAVALYLTHKKMVIDPEQYRNLTLKKYLPALVLWLVFVVMFVSINYWEAVDLAQHNRRFRLFGLNPFLYSLFESAMMLCFYGVTLWGYFAFFFIPRMFVRRWKQR